MKVKPQGLYLVHKDGQDIILNESEVKNLALEKAKINYLETGDLTDFDIYQELKNGSLEMCLSVLRMENSESKKVS